jgi:hypothetical protein
MKKIFFTLSSISIVTLCLADEFSITTEITAASLDGLEFTINDRPIAKSNSDIGSFSFVSGRSECFFKAGTNTFGIKIAAPSAQKLKGETIVQEETSRIRFLYSRDKNDETIEETWFFDEAFTVFPTNVQFIVTKDWPVKKLVWEGSSPVLNNKDRAEIIGLLKTVVDAYAKMPDARAVETLWNLEKYLNQSVFLLDGINMNELREMANEDAKDISIKYGGKVPEFKDIKFHVFSGLNLVRISVSYEDKNLGTAPIVSYRKDGSGARIGPEWFSKIDGKWWIVP